VESEEAEICLFSLDVFILDFFPTFFLFSSMLRSVEDESEGWRWVEEVGIEEAGADLKGIIFNVCPGQTHIEREKANEKHFL
jgi:hypothetical protein